MFLLSDYPHVNQVDNVFQIACGRQQVKVDIGEDELVKVVYKEVSDGIKVIENDKAVCFVVESTGIRVLGLSAGSQVSAYDTAGELINSSCVGNHREAFISLPHSGVYVIKGGNNVFTLKK